MTPAERETLLTRAYDAEQCGDLKEAERLRRLVREEAPDASPDRRAHYTQLYWPTWSR